MGWKYYLWIFAVTSSLAGVQLVYSLQFAVGVSFYMNVFGLSNSVSNIILATSGPISGFVAQPIVGVLSDNSRNSWGRRRPYILGGTILTALGMLMVAFSNKIGVALGDSSSTTTPATSSNHWRGLIFSIGGLWIMNLFANVMQGPARALINDVVDPDYLQTANAFASAAQALAAVFGGVLAGELAGNGDAYEYILSVGSVCIFLVCLPTLIVAKETVESHEGKATKTIGQVFSDIIVAFRTMPRYLGIVAFLYFLSWCAYTPQMVNLVSYVSSDLTDPPSANPTPLAFYVTSIFSAVQFVWSLVQSGVTSRVGVKNVYLATQVLATACYISLAFVTKLKALAITLLVLVSFNFAATNSIPFALVAKYTSGSSGGLFMGVLNSASVLAQVISINAVYQFISSAVNKNVKPGQDNESVAIGIAATSGLFSVIAVLWCLFAVREKPAEEDDDEKKGLVNIVQSDYETAGY